MDGTAIKTDDTEVRLDSWYFKESVEFEDRRKALREEERKLDRERREFERERREFVIEKKTEKRQREKEKQLFEMKWKILEEEIKKVASEREQVERQKRFYQYVTEHETKVPEEAGRIVRGDLFFVGVEDKQALKKRYKDLLKIYHPDNLSGDVGTIQEINREYDRLREQYQ